MKKWMKNVWWILVSLLAAWAPGMDMNLQRKLRPDAFELGGYLHQIVGRTFDAIQTDSVTLFLAMLAILWITRRYLYHKPEKTGVGEYLLCGFFSVMQLLNTAVNQTGSVQCLYANLFQLIKVCLYLPGMFVLLLCGVRGLNELLAWRPVDRRCQMWDRHPFLFSFFVLSLAWLPHLLIKYPGALTMDTALQYHQYVGIDPRTTPHPPFGTVVYGWLIDTARTTGYMNLFYFAFTFIKTACFIAVLAYGLSVMNRRNIPMWVCWFSLAMFAVSPVYVGWTTVIGKDSPYLILCMLAGIVMLENIGTGILYRSRWRKALLAVCLILMMLVRHNGILIAVPLLLCLLGRLLTAKAGRRDCIRFACYACAVVFTALGVKETIILTMDYQRISQNDWMSLMFQQTGMVVTRHDNEIPLEEKEVLNRMFVYDEIKECYTPDGADSMRWNYPMDGRPDGIRVDAPLESGRSNEDIKAYVEVWWNQFKRYPADYLDALLEMNGILFDLQANWPVYVCLTDNSLDDHVYQNSFNDMTYYNADQIRPLNGLQRALTECYYRMHELPLAGPLFSMGFCMELMCVMLYLGWKRGHRESLAMWIPSLVTGLSGLFCAIVYLRYLLPTVGAVPLWLAGWMICEEKGLEKERKKRAI